MALYVNFTPDTLDCFLLIITFVLRFFLQMKKMLLASVLLVTVFVLLGGINAFQRNETLNFTFKANSNIPLDTVYAVKYDDCIKESDYPIDYFTHSKEVKGHIDWSIKKVNESVSKFGESIDSTLKNLNTVDAHEFIHQTFQKAKNALTDTSISDIQKYYQCEIMRICHDSDRSLNGNTVGRL